LKEILGRKKLRESLKDNIIDDFEGTTIIAKRCDTDSLCIIIPKEKMEKKIINHKDL